MGDTVKVYGLPASATNEAFTRFIESHTGKGTVVSVNLKKGRRKHAIVKFFKQELCWTGYQFVWWVFLRFDGSFLKVWLVGDTIVTNPETPVQNVDIVRLHFGCQVKVIRFCAFWSTLHVSINFSLQRRMICFFLLYGSKGYKLELPYVNIWQMKLRRPREFASKYILTSYSTGVRPSINLHLHNSLMTI